MLHDNVCQRAQYAFIDDCCIEFSTSTHVVRVYVFVIEKSTILMKARNLRHICSFCIDDNLARLGCSPVAAIYMQKAWTAVMLEGVP